MNEVAALKITSLQRCVARAKQVHDAAGDNFTTNYDLQDAAILNIIRACETAIDLANMLVRKRHLGIPTESVVIPARLGSKRLPHKNALPLAGKPLVEWTIEAAIASGVAGRIVVTSDDEQVLAIASRHTEVKALKRSSDLAADTAATIDVVLDVIEHEERSGQTYETMILLQPTSPLRPPKDIIDANALFAVAGGRSVISVCEVDHPPQWCGTIDADGILQDFAAIDEPCSQELAKSYRLNGAIYIANIESIRTRRSLFSEFSVAYRMRREDSIDVDTQLDLVICEAIIGSRFARLPALSEKFRS